MLKNYFKIGWRNLTQHKTYTTINILGLTVGMACCILIALYAREELSYDTFHEKADRIVAVGYGGGTFGKSLSTPYPLADAMEQEIPEVQNATRMKSRSTIRLGLNPDEFVAVERAEYAEEDFFEVFSFKLVSGNEKEALNAPGKIVLTQSASRSLFGNENPVGESLYWLQDDTTTVLQVGGMVEDPPQNSSISFGALISFNTMHENRRRPEAWRSYSHDTYAVLKDAQSIDRLSERFEKLVQNHYENTSTEFFAVPLTSLYLSEVTSNRGFTGNSKYLYLFGSVALFILFIACVNYVNLATARVSIRAKEVGIRKSLGAHRGQVAGQFLGESVLLSIGAYLMSILLAAWLIPYFNQLFGSHLAFSDSFIFIFWLALGAVAVGILAGIYPSLYLSRFSPAAILRSRMPSGKSGSLLRKSLVVGQF
ncbi:MAG: FtsX-like permease family protein, partial [Balneolaceae bacterium]|nr:FtsX-like permease family protein [Balneolaceae bacterium]